MTDYVLIPGAHYKRICEAVRAKSGKNGLLTSNQLPAEILALKGGEEVLKDAMVTQFGPEQIDPDELYKVGYNWISRLVAITHEMAGTNKKLTPEGILVELRRVIFLPQGRAESEVEAEEPVEKVRTGTRVRNPVVVRASVTSELDDRTDPHAITRTPKPAPVTARCYETQAGTSLAGTVHVLPDDWVLATVAARSALQHPEGWQLLHETAALSTENLDQRMAMLCYHADAEEDLTVTVAQTESKRLYLNLVAVHGIAGFKYNSGTEICGNEKKQIHTAQKREGLPVLWACTASLWSTSSPFPVWYCNEISANAMQLPNNTQPRTVNFYDVDPGTARNFVAAAETAAIVDCVEIIPK